MTILNQGGWMCALLVAGALGAMGCSSDDKSDNGDSDKPAPKSGSVVVNNSKIVAGTVEAGSYQALASFVDSSGVSGGGQSGANCETSKEGSCSLVVCGSATADGGGVPAGDGGTSKIVHAGVIEITGAAESPLKLEPLSDGSYKSVQGGKSIWNGGEELKIHAAGNASGIGQFDGTLKAPSIIKLTAPTWATSATGPTITRSSDLELTWTASGTASGKVLTVISGAAAGAGAKTAALSCSFNVADLKAKVPSSLLSKLEAAPANFLLTGVDTTTQTVSGDWRVTLALQATATREGGIASGLATLK